MLRRTFIVVLLLALGCSSPLVQQSQRGKGKGPKPPPEPVEMGILFFDGGERRVDSTTSSKHPFRLNSFSSLTTPVRTGGRAFSLDAASTFLEIRNYNFDHSGGDNFWDEPSLYVSFYLRRFGSPTTDTDILLIHHTDDGALNTKLELRWGASNVLRVETASGITTGTTALNQDQWYRIDVQCNTGASAFWEVRIDNVSEISATENLNTNNASTIIFRGSAVSNSVADDIVVRDDQYHPGDDFRVETIFPDGDGNYTSWTGTWADVEEKSSDGNEVTTDTNTNRETFTLENIPALSGDDTIDSVLVLATVRKTAGGAVNCQMIERESSTDRDTANFALLDNSPLEGVYRWLIQDTKPSGGAWTESAVNGYEVGLEHNQSQARDIFLDNINVNVLISTTATPPAGANAGRMTLLGVQ